MAALLWSQQACPAVPWIVKTDDDTVNNLSRLAALLTEMRDNNET